MQCPRNMTTFTSTEMQDHCTIIQFRQHVRIKYIISKKINMLHVHYCVNCKPNKGNITHNTTNPRQTTESSAHSVRSV